MRNRVLDRFELAQSVDNLLRQAGGDEQIEALAFREGVKPRTLVTWVPVTRLFTTEQVEAEVAQPCANGRSLKWSHFEALAPLAAMPRQQGHRLAHELLGRARCGNLGARWLADQGRRLVREHKDEVVAGLDGRDDVDELRAEVADLRREVQELRQVVGIGHTRTREDDDRGEPEAARPGEEQVADEPPGPRGDEAGGASS